MAGDTCETVIVNGVKYNKGDEPKGATPNGEKPKRVRKPKE